MRKWLWLSLIGLSIFITPCYATTVSCDAFLSADDVTIAHLEQMRTRFTDAINNADGANLQNQSVTHSKLDAGADPVQRWGEAFNDWVYTGLLPTTSASLTSITSAGTAYVQGYRVVKDATSHTYNPTVWTFVDLSKNGTYTYPEVAIGATEPSTTTNSIRLARLVTDGTAVTAVRDDRVLSINLGNTSAQEDFQLKGLYLTNVSPDVTLVTVDSGLVYNGTTRIVKTSVTQLNVSSAGDYVSGVSQRATTTPLYVYVSPTAQVKLDSTKPNYHDTSGNTTGIKFYYKYTPTGVYWRCIGSVYLNSVGSGNINPSEISSWRLGDKIIQEVSNIGSSTFGKSANLAYGAIDSGTGAYTWDDSIPANTGGDQYMQLTITPTSTTSKLKIDVVFNYADSGTIAAVIGLFQDSTTNALAAVTSAADAVNTAYSVSFTYYMTAGTTSATTFKVRAGGSSGTMTFNGGSAARKMGGVSASSMNIVEIAQ